MDEAKRPFYANITEKKRRSAKPGSRSTKVDRAANADKGSRSARTDTRAANATPHGKGDKAASANPAPRPASAPARSGGSDTRQANTAPRPPRPAFKKPAEHIPVFGAVSAETKALLEAFPDIVNAAMPLDSKKKQALPQAIRDLSHELTDERSDRRLGYLNEPSALSAYIHYFMWWNLVRLTRLFGTLPIALEDGDAALDLGSGPLTLPIALWMARSDLRKKNLTWYCVDISQGALSAGEELFLNLAAKTGDEPWRIVRVKGESGVSLKRRVKLVSSANMFNELFWDNPQPMEAQAKSHASMLASYAEDSASVLVIEPGVPRAGRFISLLRDALLRLEFSPLSPCPHDGPCPFPGHRYGKWCHFTFNTKDAPAKLHALSESSYLTKDRAALSFIFAKRGDARAEEAVPGAEDAPLSALSRMNDMVGTLKVRIESDPIKLPEYRTGRYGCSRLGMVLVTGAFAEGDYLQTCESGSLIELPAPALKTLSRDEKSDALIIPLKAQRPPKADRS